MGAWKFKIPEDDARVIEPLDPNPSGGLPNFHPPIKPDDTYNLQGHIELYKLSEAAIFNFLLKMSPYRYLDISFGDGAIVDAGDDSTAIGYVCQYFGTLILEDSRPLIWINKAKESLRTLADFLLTTQRGSPTEAAANIAAFGAATATSVDYGGFLRFTVSIYSEGQGACGLALYYAYRILGDIKYRNGYLAALTCLRRMQCGGLLTNKYAVITAGGARFNSGMWSNTMVFSAGAVWRMNHFLRPDDLISLRFLKTIQDYEGDLPVGDTTAVGSFSFPTISTISGMRTAAKTFWQTGVAETVGGTPITGLSATTPREYYAGFNSDGLGGGTGTWKLLGSLITGANFAKALNGLFYDSGFSAISTIYNWLMAGMSNPAFENTSNRNQVIYLANTGVYNPKLALATYLTTTASNGTDQYDWSTQGLLAPIHAQQDLATAADSKRAVSKRYRRAYVGKDAQQMDFASLRGVSGLSFQMSGASVSGILYDTQAAAIIGMSYRENPKIYSTRDH